MYAAAINTADILLMVFTLALPIGIYLFAGYKQRPRRLYIATFGTLVALTVYLIQSQPQPTYSSDPNTGVFRFPLWAEFLLYAVLIFAPLSITFLLARFVGKKRNVTASPLGVSKIEAYLIGFAIILIAPMQPLISARDKLEASLPNPEKYVDLATPVTPETLFQTQYQTFSPATAAKLAETHSWQAFTFPPASTGWIVINTEAPHMVFIEQHGDTMRVGLVDVSKTLTADNPHYIASFERFLSLLRFRVQ